MGVVAMRDLISRFVADRRGGIAAEYALAAGLLGAALALGLAALGDALGQSYEPVTVVTAPGYDLTNQRGF
jgi:Flp pilus assembly pilin Flp